MGVLLADIGGTNCRCAIGASGRAVAHFAAFRNREFPDLATLLAAYTDSLPESSRPTSGALAVAAPIHGDDVQMINIDWRFSRPELRRQLGLSELHILNDFAALAWSLPQLLPADLVQVGGGTSTPGYPRAVLGPGTGLGVASLIPVAGGWQSVAGEGGHVTLPAVDDEEERVIGQARRQFGHCSAERLLSGAGLEFLHAALHGGPQIPAASIGARAAEGDQPAQKTFERFFRLLGTVASNLALTLGASGGIYIGGGIVPRYLDAFLASGFRERFESKGRYRAYLQAIPTWVITAEHPTLTGLLAYAAR